MVPMIWHIKRTFEKMVAVLRSTSFMKIELLYNYIAEHPLVAYPNNTSRQIAQGFLYFVNTFL